MNKLELMRRLIIGLIAWNGLMSLCLGLFIYNQQQEDLNIKISNLEAIPPLEVIEEEF